MKPLLTFFFIFSIVSLSAQSECDTSFAKNDTLICWSQYSPSTILLKFYYGGRHLYSRYFYRTYTGEVIWETHSSGVLERKDGDAGAFYPNGAVKSQFHYKKDKKEGLSKGYYLNGQLQYETLYHKDKRHGDERLYYDNGQLHAHLYHRHGRLQHILERYDRQGRLLAVGEFRNGRGKVLIYDDEGAPIGIDYYRHGKYKHSKRNQRPADRPSLWDEDQLEWGGLYPNGRIKFRLGNRPPRLTGVQEDFNENGTRHCLCTYRQGKLHGEQSFYYDNQQLASRVYYDNGRLLRFIERYDRAGRPLAVGNFADGTGEVLVFSPSGKVVGEQYFRKGKFIRYKRRATGPKH